jgi:Na+:H+ antiporter, NhaC family
VFGTITVMGLVPREQLVHSVAPFSIPESSWVASNSPAVPINAKRIMAMTSATGYVANTGVAALDEILTRGGMSSMMTTVWLIITALSFGAVVEHAGLLNRLIDPLVERVKSVAGLVATTVATAIGINIMASDQYIAIALPGRLFAPAFSKRGLEPAMLSRVVGDSATVTSPLIPWNSCGAYMAAALGVPTMLYAGFCFFNILNPLLTILLSIMGWRVLRVAPTISEQPS